MSYKIKIIDNDNGRVVADEDEAVAIVGAIVMKATTMGLYSTACDSKHCAMGIHAAQMVCKMAKKKNRVIGAMVSMAELNEDELETVEIDLSEIRKKKNGD